LRRTRVGSKGEIFPSKEIREKLGLRPGTKVDLQVEDSRLIVKPTSTVNDLLRSVPTRVEITAKEFHKFRRQLSKKGGIPHLKRIVFLTRPTSCPSSGSP
jgi:AbrB family looped-hinge helix DNA binding protein